MRLIFSRAASTAFIGRDQLAFFYIEAFITLDDPFVETAAAEGEPSRLFGWFFLFEGKDVAHEITYALLTPSPLGRGLG